ncbi:glycosyltransferase [Tellurirhabdus bombi]|uniref:glycosyltransferase n=1 Tax=Tellurirhabdus bombi TaxID=2907205 RepID=UPI001F267192|nr:glycosyltransferase [Tellurirhabdus bombi]
MNILRVIASMDPSTGGPCQGIRNSISALKEVGIQNEVVSLDDPSVAFPIKDAFPIHKLGPSKKPWNHSPKLAPWLLDNLGRFDAVIVHGLWQYHSYATQKAVQTFRRQSKRNQQEKSKMPKLFVMPHGMLDPYFQRAPGRKLKAIRNWVYWKLIEARVVNQADGLFFTCEEELRLARTTFNPYHPKKEINVGYGVPEPKLCTPALLEAFLNKLPVLRGQPYFLFLSRLHDKKGVDLLINAYADVVEKTTKLSSISDAKVSTDTHNSFPRLVIAGPGKETPYGQKLQDLVNSNPQISDKVFFPGMLTGDDKWSAFYGCEAFVLPSHQENFGISVVEALACGKPVLISDQINIWREIDSFKGGIVQPDTQVGTTQLLDNWLNLAKTEELVMGRQARATYESYFAIEPAANRLVEAIATN